MTRFAAAALAAVCLIACRDVDVVTASYATLDEARRASAVQRGHIPEGLPPGSSDIREAFDTDTNRQWGLFSFPTAEAAHLKAILEETELPLTGQQCAAPRRIEWWPVLLRGQLDAERIHATGLRAYRSRDRERIFAVNWNQGRAYYWSAAE